MSRYLDLVICLLCGAVLPFVVAFLFPIVRPFPDLFSFSKGFWNSKSPPMERRIFSDLKADVDVDFDANGIPHVIARNDEDLYFAQGVLSAHFRLFQMDVTTRAGMGRLSEFFGRKTFPVDKFFVTFGIRQAVHKMTEQIKADPQTAAAAEAYVKGVNAYISSLDQTELPVEYKVLGIRPELWTIDRISALVKIMTFRLAGRSNDLLLTQILQKLGSEKTAELFPEFLPHHLESYFIGSSVEERRREDFWAFDYVSKITEFPLFLQPVEVHGSNAWAVGPEKSKTGYSILANDTHLSLQLPSVWFESQLISPTTNVYGAIFPGAPGVVLGFNPQLAWGTTNGTTDVMDWFEVDLKDATSFDYKWRGEWQAPKIENERIVIRDEPAIDVPVVFTNYGVLMSRQKNLGLVARWTGSEPSNEMKVLMDLDHGRSDEDCLKALRGWKAPVQNFVCVDEKNVSIYHAGRIPKRVIGGGRVIERAENEKALWAGDIAFADLPHEQNPERGFVFSANERPVGPEYAEYLGWDFEEPFRGKRIRQYLTDKSKLDGGDFMQIQNDALNEHAALAMPHLMKFVRVDDLSETEKTVFEAMKQWDFLERAKSFEPSVFSLWWRNLEADLWNEVKVIAKPLYPKKARTLWFFERLESGDEKAAQWLKPFDSGEQLVTKAFHDAIDELAKKYGADPGRWHWSDVQPTDLPHVAKFPGFGSEKIVMDGGQYSIMANKGHHGPAWKLVVEMGPQLRAWSQIPGGITGNPLDPEYEKFVGAWSRGDMRPVVFWKDAKDASVNSSYIWKWSRM